MSTPFFVHCRAYVTGSPFRSWLVIVAVSVSAVLGLAWSIVTESTTGATLGIPCTVVVPESVKVPPAAGRNCQS
jgi:hypothetical protein